MLQLFHPRLTRYGQLTHLRHVCFLMRPFITASILLYFLSLMLIIAGSLGNGNRNLPGASPKKRLVITRSVTKLMMPEKIERVERVERVDRVDLAELAETLKRVRAKSVGERENPPAPSGARKRTSSGVFQVDEAEPPSKKIELLQSNSESKTRKKSKEIPNGRRKTSESDAGVQETTKRTVVIEKFDSKSASNCVTAFKESDNWD